MAASWRFSAVSVLLAGIVAGCASPPATTPDPIGDMIRQRGLAPSTGAADGPSADLVLVALNFIDTPYRRGGHSADPGFDCSGFTRHVYASALGLQLPRRAEDQAREPSLLDINADALRPGDLVFFNTLQRSYSHVGIYIGDGRFVHAPRSGAQVRVESMQLAYWSQRFDGARRAPALDNAAP